MPRTSIRLQQIWNWPSEAMWHENTSSFESSEAQLSVVGFVEDDSFCLGSCAALFVAMLDGLAIFAGIMAATQLVIPKFYGMLFVTNAFLPSCVMLYRKALYCSFRWYACKHF